MGEAEPLQKELPCVLHPLVVAAPVLQPVVTEVLHDVQPLLATENSFQYLVFHEFVFTFCS